MCTRLQLSVPNSSPQKRKVGDWITNRPNHSTSLQRPADTTRRRAGQIARLMLSRALRIEMELNGTHAFRRRIQTKKVYRMNFIFIS